MPSTVSNSRSSAAARANHISPAPARAGHRTPAAAAPASSGPNDLGAVYPTSLKLPAGLKARIDEAASREGVSAHAYMLQTLAKATERARLREQFVSDAQEALQDMIENGREYDLADVREYFAQRDKWRNGDGSKPRRPTPARRA